VEPKYAWVGSLHQQVNWTAGCIAVTNPEIDEIWPLLTAYAAGKNGITSCLPTIRERREPATFTAQFCTR
jgi:hypothetical protein